MYCALLPRLNGSLFKQYFFSVASDKNRPLVGMSHLVNNTRNSLLHIFCSNSHTFIYFIWTHTRVSDCSSRVSWISHPSALWETHALSCLLHRCIVKGRYSDRWLISSSPSPLTALWAHLQCVCVSFHCNEAMWTGDLEISNILGLDCKWSNSIVLAFLFLIMLYDYTSKPPHLFSAARKINVSQVSRLLFRSIWN